MARSRKKSLGQQVVGAAVIAMPAPVQKVAGSRWGSRLILLVAPLLFITGIATVDWSEGRPKIRFNRERAQEVREKLVREVEADAGIKLGQEVRPAWNLPNEQHAMPAPIQPFAGNGPSQASAVAFPRLESAANSAVGLLEAPPRYFLPENNGSQQVPGSVQPGARY